jgi:hypothetical protein
VLPSGLGCFLPSIQMLSSYLLYFKKIREKHHINSHHLLHFFFSFSWFLSGGLGSMSHGRRPTHQLPWVTVGQARPDPAVSLVVTHSVDAHPPWSPSPATFSPDLAIKFVFNASKSVSNASKIDSNATNSFLMPQN